MPTPSPEGSEEEQDDDLPSVEDATGGGGSEILPLSDGEGAEERENSEAKTPSSDVKEGGGGGEELHPPSENEEGGAVKRKYRRRSKEGTEPKSDFDPREDPCYDKGIEDVEVTPDTNNAVTLTGKGVSFTPLAGIGGIPVTELSVASLRLFCVNNGIKGSRAVPKGGMCWAICRAKKLHSEGKRPPYRGLMPGSHLIPPPNNPGIYVQNDYNGNGGGDLDDFERWKSKWKSKERRSEGYGNVDGGVSAWVGGDGGDLNEQMSKKRRVEEARSLPPSLPPAAWGASPPHHPHHHPNRHSGTPAPGLSKKHQGELVRLQGRLVRSKESTNRAIELRETIESASALRREMREEKGRRAALWKRFVEKVGDESLAAAHVRAHRGGARDEGEAKGTYESLIEDVIEQDDVIRRMAYQYDALIDAVDQLIADKKNSVSNVADV